MDWAVRQIRALLHAVWMAAQTLSRWDEGGVRVRVNGEVRQVPRWCHESHVEVLRGPFISRLRDRRTRQARSGP